MIVAFAPMEADFLLMFSDKNLNLFEETRTGLDYICKQ